MTDTDETLSIGTAARLLGVSVDTVRRWEAEGKITATRTPGNQRRIPRSEVDRLRGLSVPISSEGA
jgi:putative resolvase